MPNLGLRDRDGITTKEGLILRVFGYTHPSNAYVCDPEYAPAGIFKSDNPKALREGKQHIFYKFYEDESWRFVRDSFPQYMIFHEMLQKNVIGVHCQDIFELRRPNVELERLVERQEKDELLVAMQAVLDFVTKYSSLSVGNFGVFGSILHGLYNPRFSDIDLVIYGKEEADQLRNILRDLYATASPLQNEFATGKSIKGKHWRFSNFSHREFVWHQRRKLIYALFADDRSGRTVKVEFEPVKKWKEIRNEYDPKTRIVRKGWVKMVAQVVRADEAPFIPSIYEVAPLKILDGAKEANEAVRVISYLEEFRMQAWHDEIIYVEGNLEEVITRDKNFHQIVLTYCQRYYEQTLKVSSNDLFMPKS